MGRVIREVTLTEATTDRSRAGDGTEFIMAGSQRLRRIPPRIASCWYLMARVRSRKYITGWGQIHVFLRRRTSGKLSRGAIIAIINGAVGSLPSQVMFGVIG